MKCFRYFYHLEIDMLGKKKVLIAKMQIRILYNLLVWIFKTCFMILIHLSVRDLKADLTSNVLCLRKEKRAWVRTDESFLFIYDYTWIGNECGMLVVCSYLFPFCPWPSSACLLLFLWQKKCCLWNGSKKLNTTADILPIFYLNLIIIKWLYFTE